MATITGTESGKWKAMVRMRGWPSAIKTFARKRDAQDWARRIEDEMVRGVYINRAPSERMRVSEALQRYLLEVTPTKKASTQVGEHKKARPLLAYFSAYSLAAVTPDLVAKYRDKRLAVVKPDTVRLELALLSHLFNVAIREWGLGLVRNPVSVIRKPSPGRGRDRRLTPDEERRLLAAADAYSNPMLGWIVRLAIQTGMRKGEIKALRCPDVDLQRRVVLLRDPKTEVRTVPLTLAATAVMEQALNNPMRPEGCDLIFFGEPGRDGRRRAYQFEPAWMDLKAELGMKDLRFHDLRHEAVSRLYGTTLRDMEVAAISGHKSMQTLRRYAHLRNQHLVARLDEIDLDQVR